MNIAHIDITTKKNTTAGTQWRVHQDRPYPNIEGGSHLRWRNAGGILPEYGRAADGIGSTYTASLLRSDFDPSNPSGNRLDQAGYKGNPSFEYRGKQIGEVDAEIKPDCNGGYVRFRVPYGQGLTPSEQKLLEDQAAPALLEYVRANRDRLKAEAIEDIKKSVANHIARARHDLDEIETEMDRAISQL